MMKSTCQYDKMITLRDCRLKVNIKRVCVQQLILEYNENGILVGILKISIRDYDVSK